MKKNEQKERYETPVMDVIIVAPCKAIAASIPDMGEEEI